MNRVYGGVLFVLLITYAALKAAEGALPELLWASHVNSALLAAGLLLGLPSLVAIGFVYHLGVAAPAYVLYLLAGGDTNWASVLLHALSPIFGWLACRGRPLPRATVGRAFSVYVGLVVLSRLLTPEALNVNLAFKPWSASPLLGIWENRVLNALLVLVCLAAGQWIFHRLSAPRQAASIAAKN